MVRHDRALMAATGAAMLVAAQAFAAEPQSGPRSGGAKGNPPDAPIIALPAPPATAFQADGIAKPSSQRSKVRLRIVYRKRHKHWANDVVFRRRHGLSRRLVSPFGPPRVLPDDGGKSRRIYLIDNGRMRLGIYRGGAKGPYLIGFETGTGRRGFAFAFPAWRDPGRQTLQWAWRERDVLYVAHAHDGYARRSGGRNAYISALALSDGKLLWRSRPLVANTRNFIVVRDAIVAAYGYTSESNALYVLDKGDGAVVQRIALAAGPLWLYRRGNRVYVSGYPENTILAIR